MKFVKMIRYHNCGFRCGLPNTDCMDGERNPVFINREVQNLFNTGQPVYTTEITLPKEADQEWSGCFCYLEEYTHPATENRNIGFLPKESIIWVRNMSHLDNGTPFYNRSVHPLAAEEARDKGNMVADTWVKMRVEDALERTRLWKEKCTVLPDWVTECYLMEHQVNNLIYPSSTEKVMEFWLSKH
ncbi:hypothetical protein LCL96_16485 [Rossellomorea aquimaris]|uniref:hypothetical protein n=1 Tax=Rossellomorea aquimaris TaxID=189382 RepID=UPI001CD4D082|nr:hypothetical protein [Rossellomorea aquimaris]MCA1060535.1 hypothetical protein [Rossellomorea aquimaris]